MRCNPCTAVLQGTVDARWRRMISPSVGALDAIYGRRATSTFTGEQISDTIVRELLRAAVHTRTAHLDPWAFVIVQRPDLLACINRLAIALARTTLVEASADIFRGARTLIVICAKPLCPTASTDCWLAAENLMLAASSRGLATCPSRLALLALCDPEIKVELGIPRDVTPVAPIIVGVPSGSGVTTSRREPEILGWK